MRKIIFGAICFGLLAGCQTIPWRESGPLMKFVNIAAGTQECLALADIEGAIMLHNGKAIAIDSPDAEI